MDTENLNEELVSSSIVNKWKAVLDESNSNYAPIKGAHRRRVTAQLLENTVFELKNNRSMYGVLSEGPSVNVVGAGDRSATAGAIDYVDPVLISMIRRAGGVAVCDSGSQSLAVSGVIAGSDFPDQYSVWHTGLYRGSENRVGLIRPARSYFPF